MSEFMPSCMKAIIITLLPGYQRKMVVRWFMGYEILFLLQMIQYPWLGFDWWIFWPENNPKIKLRFMDIYWNAFTITLVSIGRLRTKITLARVIRQSQPNTTHLFLIFYSVTLRILQLLRWRSRGIRRLIVYERRHRTDTWLTGNYWLL